jgi:hypothetical protein
MRTWSPNTGLVHQPETAGLDRKRPLPQPDAQPQTRSTIARLASRMQSAPCLSVFSVSGYARSRTAIFHAASVRGPQLAEKRVDGRVLRQVVQRRHAAVLVSLDVAIPGAPRAHAVAKAALRGIASFRTPRPNHSRPESVAPTAIAMRPGPHTQVQPGLRIPPHARVFSRAQIGRRFRSLAPPGSIGRRPRRREMPPVGARDTRSSDCAVGPSAQHVRHTTTIYRSSGGTTTCSRLRAELSR